MRRARTARATAVRRSSHAAQKEKEGIVPSAARSCTWLRPAVSPSCGLVRRAFARSPTIRFHGTGTPCSHVHATLVAAPRRGSMPCNLSFGPPRARRASLISVCLVFVVVDERPFRVHAGTRRRRGDDGCRSFSHRLCRVGCGCCPPLARRRGVRAAPALARGRLLLARRARDGRGSRHWTRPFGAHGRRRRTPRARSRIRRGPAARRGATAMLLIDDRHRQSKKFDAFILVCIVANCILMAASKPENCLDKDAPDPWDFQAVADIVFNIIFLLEFLIKVRGATRDKTHRPPSAIRSEDPRLRVASDRSAPPREKKPCAGLSRRSEDGCARRRSIRTRVRDTAARPRRRPACAASGGAVRMVVLPRGSREGRAPLGAVDRPKRAVLARRASAMAQFVTRYAPALSPLALRARARAWAVPLALRVGGV